MVIDFTFFKFFLIHRFCLRSPRTPFEDFERVAFDSTEISITELIIG